MSIPVTLSQRGVGRNRHWEARIGELTADGKTKTDAKQEVEALAVAVLSGDATPRLVRMAGSPPFLLVWRELTGGWCYKVIYDEPPASPEAEQMSATTAYHSPAAAERHGRRELAELVFLRRGEAAAFSVLADPADRADLAHWIGFQRAYKAVEASGEPDPHRWAGEHASDQEFAVQVPPAS